MKKNFKLTYLHFKFIKKPEKNPMVFLRFNILAYLFARSYSVREKK